MVRGAQACHHWITPIVKRLHQWPVSKCWANTSAQRCFPQRRGHLPGVPVSIIFFQFPFFFFFSPFNPYSEDVIAPCPFFTPFLLLFVKISTSWLPCALATSRSEISCNVVLEIHGLRTLRETLGKHENSHVSKFACKHTCGGMVCM